MKNRLNKKLVVRITENQYRRLKQNILEDKVSMSQVIREALENKINKIEIDDTQKRKFRY
jgi:predicted HicB family RNase H-like nuclease